jgi:16S rRNA (uracil1498-N3)-methyltransferase
VTSPAALSEVAARAAAADRAVVLDPQAPDGLDRLPLPTSGEVLLIVGPEGGISPAEASALAQAGAAGAHLGPTVLRTSSAGPVAAAVVLSRAGRWA